MTLGPKPMDAFIDDMLTSECSEQVRKYHSMLLDGGFFFFFSISNLLLSVYFSLV